MDKFTCYLSLIAEFSFIEIGKELGRRWSELSDAQKAVSSALHVVWFGDKRSNGVGVQVVTVHEWIVCVAAVYL